jgi:acyl-CoA synthetase (AMP-forming)/AMP-acid ligase II
MVITEVLERNAERYGGEVALVELNPEAKERHDSWKEFDLVEMIPVKRHRREMTWAEFNERTNRTADLLAKKGIGRGDKVAILLMNCLEWLPIYFGVLKLGALAVPLNFRYTADEIRYCLGLADCCAIVFGGEFVERMDAIRDGIPKVKTVLFMEDVGEKCPVFAESYYGLLKDTKNIAPGVKLEEQDDAAIYFSSGTTGFPKAILHNHESLISACETEQNHHGQRRDDIFLCIPPLYHTGAKMHWFGSFLAGSRAVLLRGVKPRWIIEAVSSERVTIVWLLVPWAQDILDAIDRGELDLKDYELDQWRLMHIGAQPVPPSLIRRWKKVFPHHQYDTNYGLSESTGPGCVHLGVENTHKVGAIGVPGYRWEAKIVDEQRRPVKEGDVGELAVRGPGVMTCYYHNEAATKEVLDGDGWLYTGDMAMRDDDGFIFLVDRKKDVIISGGENLYPVQIEDFLRAHDAIKDVAVIGLPDARLGEIPAAIIELKSGRACTEEEIKLFCEGLPRYKRPRKIIFAEIPRNPTGKIEKPKLRKIYCGESLVAAQMKS